MKRLFLDTNVILDLLAQRSPFYESIAKIATLADQKKVILVATPISFTTAEYILAKFDSLYNALLKLRKFKIICEVCSVDDEIIEKALNADFPDFEDAVLYFSALKTDSTVIITRNGKDFDRSSIPVLTADEFLRSLP